MYSGCQCLLSDAASFPHPRINGAAAQYCERFAHFEPGTAEYWRDRVGTYRLGQ